MWNSARERITRAIGAGAPPSARTLQAALRRAWGREPTRIELERILRVREAFDIGENDAFLTIAAVLEFYDALYRQYPDRCAEATRRAIREGLHSPGSSSNARVPSGNDLEFDRVTIACLGAAFSVLLGALGMAVGARGAPFWLDGRPRTAVAGAVSSVLGAPAGWILLLVMLVPVGYAGFRGCARARRAASEWRERALGAAAASGVGLALVGWLVLLAWALK